MITFSPFLSNFDFMGSGTPNFSYIIINEGDEQTIPIEQQMLISGHLTVLGHLTILGSLIDISARIAKQFFYDKIVLDEVVEIPNNMLLLFNNHLTIHGHLRINGRLKEV